MKPALARPILFAPGPLPWLKPAFLVGGLVPLLSLLVGAYRGTLGAEPIERSLNQLGLLGLIFLIASLTCTPLQTLTGAAWPLRLRKLLGLLGFFYISLHFLTYVVLDQGFKLSAILADLAKHTFILVGFLAFVLLIPLAVTSTAAMVKRLRFARWKRLHRLAYVTAVLGVIHFYLRVKKDHTEPILYGVVLAVLFAIRIAAAVKGQGAKPGR